MSGDAEMTKENIMCVLASFPWPQQAQYNQLQEKRLFEPRGYGEFTPQLLGPWLLSLEQCRAVRVWQKKLLTSWWLKSKQNVEKGAGTPVSPLKGTPTMTWVPAQSPTSYRSSHLPIAPEADDQNFVTWAFGEHLPRS